MREWQSQSHVRWYGRDHVVWVPKYRKRAIFGEMRRGVGRIVRGVVVSGTAWSWWKGTRCRITCMSCWVFHRS